ncbi:arabinose-5-phosphate isomerase [Tistlia consotensis]|uniref:Arabinose-5-phosphate isomerase n=1 Tax=Tistlia consotensis USBA 355 TaxID=560819 RepID=A0A1Y6B9Z0_9PROT|nr:KpsF/GutQ family sugar-phosphate isomerase [Tistlia consotensis]SME99215.1 arabinose-5-phosphate isomerase [Tistlia consotensis USBA 355]SNR77254.1 arabinose-5-phosphate isomerase [Tistlia consotensis]
MNKPILAADRFGVASAVPGLDPAAILETARQVVATQRDGLGALSTVLGDSFVEAVRIIAAAPGHVIVTGMGKSGHVGRKIAATFASTGTPSFFVHPGEASHGDLGMITESNVLLAISNSGETSELSDLLVYSRRYGIPLIAISSRSDSTLARQADAALVLPAVDEACPLGLAPTTSTTLTMVIGDALAVALLGLKGFTRDDFRDRHPGGRLGNVLLRVGDIMHHGAAVPVIATGSAMGQALIRMSEGGFGCVGVTDAEGRLVGIVTDGDLRRHMSGDLLAQPVEAVMTPDPKTIEATALAAEALKVMNASKPKINALFIVEDGRPVGFLHLHDCLRAGVY